MDRIVAIGTSQGGVDALHHLIAGLPGDFPAPILVVLHIGAGESVLPALLSAIDGLPARFARHGEAIKAGHIHIAPPDHHMLLRDGQIELTRGPRENWARPAVDPLFRSAALAYGAGAIGIVLTGRLNDGTAGLYEIKRHGGIAIVQTPATATAPDMPQSALDNVPVDYCLPVGEMPRLLVRLTREAGGEKPARAPRRSEPQDVLKMPTAQTCPECGGAMREEKLGNLTRFRCHIGHVMTAEVLADAQLAALDEALSTVLRLLNERNGLCHELAEKCRAAGRLQSAALWDKASRQAASREEVMQLLTEEDWIRSEPGETGEPAAAKDRTPPEKAAE